MQEVLRANPGDDLRAYFIWLPMFSGDGVDRAQVRADEFSEERLVHLWDGDRLTGELWQGVLGIGSVAWDVYFLYAPDARWVTDPPAPDLWMHQLGGVTNGPFLNRPEFDRQLKNMLEGMSVSRQPGAMIDIAVVETKPVPVGAE